MEIKKCKRGDLDKKYKWNLSNIYKNWDDWKKDTPIIKEILEKIVKYKGKLQYSSENLLAVITLEEELSKTLNKIYVYPYLMRDLNSKDENANSKLQEVQFILTNIDVETSWINSEILKIPVVTMKHWITKHEVLKNYRFNIEEIYRLKKHVLDEDKEKLLSYYSQYFGASSDIYKELTTSDIKWKKVKLLNGFESEITNGTYAKIVSTNRNQEDRKKAFEALYSSYEVNKNTYASIYKSIVHRNVASSKAKKFENSLQKYLEPKNISEKVFYSLLNSAKEMTGPLKRYMKLRKKILNLKEYHYYDNSINLSNFNREFSYEEAKNIVFKSVIPLGEKYQEKLSKALSEGWIDVFETENKRSGAYSMNVYDAHPYILLNYQGTLNDVFTLAHELGHSMHSILSNENQPYATSRYTIFVAEVASTLNERLLLKYMIENSSDSSEKIYLIEKALNNIVGTFFMQTLFANYENKVHNLVEEGHAITSNVLSGIIKKLFKDYFGSSIEHDDLLSIIWTRIPHFFNSPYYVYQYATSFVASTDIFYRMTSEKYSEEEKGKTTNRYLGLLKSGGNNHPIEQLKKSGVDLEENETFKIVFEEFELLLDKLEKELEVNLICKGE